MVTGFGQSEILDRAEIARRPLQVEECALLVIDIQERLLPHMFNREDVLFRV